MKRVAIAIALVACKHDPVPAGIHAAAVATPPNDPSSPSSSSAAPVASVPSVPPPRPHPNDAEARSEGESGYAKLLAGRLDEASASFEDAIHLDPSANIESQLEFNIGLVEEKRGNGELARAAFAKANALHPSNAAQTKLAGRSPCAASVQRESMSLGPHDGGVASDYVLTTSWRDVYAFAAERGSKLLGSPRDWTLKPATDAQARSLLLDDGGAPWIIDVGHLMFRDGFVYVAAASRGRILAIDGGMNGGGCVGMGARSLSGSGVELHGTVVEMTWSVEWFSDAICKAGGDARKDEGTVFYDPESLHIVTIGAPASIAGRTITIAAASCDPITL